MTPPSDIEAVAKRVLELAASATEEPWLVSEPERDRGVEYRHIYSEQRRGFDVDEPRLEAMYQIPGDAAFIAAVRTLAPQLAQAVQKMLPVIEAARVLDDVIGEGIFEDASDPAERLGAPRVFNPRLSPAVDALRAALNALTTPSPLAAEGTTE